MQAPGAEKQQQQQPTANQVSNNAAAKAKKKQAAKGRGKNADGKTYTTQLPLAAFVKYSSHFLSIQGPRFHDIQLSQFHDNLPKIPSMET